MHLLGIAHVGQRPVQRDHVAGHQIELVLLELLQHLRLLLGGNAHRFAELTGAAEVLRHNGGRPPLAQLTARVFARNGERPVGAVQIVVRVDLVVVDDRIVVVVVEGGGAAVAAVRIGDEFLRAVRNL